MASKEIVKSAAKVAVASAAASVNEVLSDSTHVAESESYQGEEKIIFHAQNQENAGEFEMVAPALEFIDEGQSWVVPSLEARRVATSMNITLKPFLPAKVCKIAEDLVKDKRVIAAALDNPDLQSLIYGQATQRLQNEGYADLGNQKVSPAEFVQRLANSNLQDGRSQLLGPSSERKEEDSNDQGTSFMGESVHSWSHTSESYINAGRALWESDQSAVMVTNTDEDSTAGRNVPETVPENSAEDHSTDGSESLRVSGGRAGIRSWEVLRQDYACELCNKVMVESHIVNCRVGHNYCGKCIKDWLAQNAVDGVTTQTCSKCGDEISSIHAVLRLDQLVEKAVEEMEDCPEKEEWAQRRQDARQSAQDDTFGRTTDEPNNNTPNSQSPGGGVLKVVLTVAVVIVGVLVVRRISRMNISSLMRMFQRMNTC